MAYWSGQPVYATKKQLVSSISGLYEDIQDINLSTVTVNTVSASTGTIQLLGVSTLSFKGFDSFLDLDFSFDLGIGDAVGGLLGGLGGIVGGAFIGLGTGAGLGIQGITNGLFSLANTQSGTQINSNVFETVNGTTQLQISTLGDAFPLYSSIFRSVSSLSPNTVPGQEIFLSTFFQPGTTCIRSVSDPLTPLTKDSNINTSTIQSFGEWVPFFDPTVTGEDIIARDVRISSLQVFPPQGSLGIGTNASNALPFDLGFVQQITMQSTTTSLPVPYDPIEVITNGNQYISLFNITYQENTFDFISSSYNQYTSTIGDYIGGVFFIQSTITDNLSTIPLFTWVGAGGIGNFAICEVDESGFRSTATMDFVAQSDDIVVQWGLAVNNRNSTIAVGTGKRVTWDNTANTSNFIDIPVPQSTIINNTQSGYSVVTRPFEILLDTVADPDPTFASGLAGLAVNVSRATLGATTTFSNQPNYPYQINGNLFINGNLEADTLIAISSIVNVSTNIQTFFSTQTFDADEATISSAIIGYANISNLNVLNNQVNTEDINIGNISTLNATFFSSFTIDNYRIFNQFLFTSTLVVDFQILEGTTGGTIAYLNKLQANTGGSYVKDYSFGSFANLSTINCSNASLFATSGTIPTLTTTTVTGTTLNATTVNTTALNTTTLSTPTVNGNSLFGQFLTVSTITTSSINTNTINSEIQTIQNLNFSTLTVPNLNYSSFYFDSTLVETVNEQPNRYIFPTDGYGRVVATSLFPVPTLSTSGWTTITNPIVLPFNDKMFRLDVVCSLANANRQVQAAVGAFVNGGQGVSRTLYPDQNPFDFLFSPQVSLIVDPRVYGVINTLDIRFFLQGAPQVGEFPLLDAVYFSLM